MLRRKYWILGGGVLGLMISSLYLISSKPVYQGEFKIVLAGESAGSGVASLLASNPTIAAIAGLNDSSNDSIGTEVEILNSPSVLLPVFEAVKASKSSEDAKGMRFHKWSKSAITVKEEKGTTVLSVEFRDHNKELVLPITKMISEAYQSYSNRGRARELNNLIIYLKEQISLIKPKADASSQAALDYGYENGLGIIDGLPLAGNVSGAGATEGSGEKVTGNGGSIEAERTATQQKVKALEIQIQQASKAGGGSLYFASQLASLTDKSSTFDQLTTVETKLAEYRSRFNENDPLVQKLNRERKSLIRYINQQTIALLNGELDLERANLTALNRPKHVVARHRELTQQALRDEATMVTLQNQLKQFELEQARSTSPWELISTPTLLDNPVSPRKRRNLAFGLLTGLFLGSGVALMVDRKSGRVYSLDELKRDLPGPLLERLPYHNGISGDSWASEIQLLVEGPLIGSGSVALIPVGDIETSVLDYFASKLNFSLGLERDLIVSRDLLTTRNANTQLLLTAPGAAKREQLRQLSEQLALQGRPLAGWVLLDPELEA